MEIRVSSVFAENYLKVIFHHSETKVKKNLHRLDRVIWEGMGKDLNKNKLFYVL